MSVEIKPVEQLEFRGVYTQGNPVNRPRNTAEVCEDFRVMPGNWLRLRSGRTARSNTAGGTILNIAPFRNVNFWGSDQQIAQVVFGGSIAWHWFSLNNYFINGGTQVESISTGYDGAFASSHIAAVTNLTDRPVLYNGLGVRDGSNSRPPFSQYPSSGIRYFGLDCFLSSGTLPSVTIVAGGYNKFLTSCDLYVGLWNSASDHYSNGVIVNHFLGVLPASTIQVSNLNRLSYATHGGSETAELFYVFYATIDGGQVPYLILNTALTGPYAVPVTSTTAALSLDVNADNGWNLDLAHEMPTENHPPRPMRSIAYVNGRIYGVLMPGGANGGTPSSWAVPFSYVPTNRETAAVCWSAAAGDNAGSDFLGDPLQSWPLQNLSYTPSGEQPLIVAPSIDGRGLFVATSSSTFILTEQADGLQEWTTISRVHGIGNPNTLRTTRYGLVWMDQRNQMVLLPPQSYSQTTASLLPMEVRVLSNEFSHLLVGTVRCADYILDPQSEIDRYQVWFDTGKSVCYDFGLQAPGVAYSCTNHDFTAATSAVDSSGRSHHIVAKGGLYTHETQPEGGIPVTDQTFNNTFDQTVSTVNINGKYIRNWDDFGDADIRKELPMVDVTGDGNPAASLGGASPLTVEWYGDFEQVIDANKKVAASTRITQSATLPTFRCQLASANRFWYKLVFKLAGHNGEVGPIYPDPATEGNLASNFYGSLLRLLWRLGSSENRP